MSDTSTPITACATVPCHTHHIQDNECCGRRYNSCRGGEDHMDEIRDDRQTDLIHKFEIDMDNRFALLSKQIADCCLENSKQTSVLVSMIGDLSKEVIKSEYRTREKMDEDKIRELERKELLTAIAASK